MNLNDINRIIHSAVRGGNPEEFNMGHFRKKLAALLAKNQFVRANKLAIECALALRTNRMAMDKLREIKNFIIDEKLKYLYLQYVCEYLKYFARDGLWLDFAVAQLSSILLKMVIQ